MKIYVYVWGGLVTVEKTSEEDLPLKIRGISHWSIFTATDYITMPYGIAQHSTAPHRTTNGTERCKSSNGLQTEQEILRVSHDRKM